MRSRWLVACAIAACTHAHPVPVAPPPPPPPLDVPPTLSLATPERGAFVDGTATLAVTGRATDDGAVRVVVNGLEAAVAPDGTFAATLPLTPGVTIVETHAIDATGHDVRDVRAVLVGPFAPSDGSARAPIGVRLGRGGLATLASSLAASLAAVDFAALARRLNPIYDDDGCLGARVDIAELAIGKVGLALAPKPGAIDTSVTIDDVVVRLDVRYEVACISGHTTSTVHTKVRARGDLRAALRDGLIRTSLAARVTLDDFQIDTAGVPDRLESLLRSTIRGAVESTVAHVLADDVPPIVDARLAALLANPPSPSVLGRALTIDIAPRAIDLAASGVFVAADAALVVADGRSGRYVAAPAAFTAIDRSDPGVWIAADTVNQLLAGLWAARAFDRTLARADVGPLALFLGGDVQSFDLHLALPPTVVAGELAIGELIVTTRDGTGAELQRFAIALRGALAPTPSTPTVAVQVLAQRPGLERPLDGDLVEGIVKTAWGLGIGAVGGSLVGVPLGGTGFQIRGMTARDGMLVFDL